jgi:hypothetical protein
MTVRASAWMLTAALLAAGAVRSDDSKETLSEAAAREKARRSAQKAKGVKKFTDEDLRKLGGKPGAKPAAAASPQQAAPDKSAVPDDPASDPSRAEFWRPRAEPAKQNVARCEAVVSSLETRLKELRMSQGRPVRLGEPNRDLAIAHDIQSTLEEMETAKRAVDGAKQALEDILEEARRAGVPASQLE